MHRWYLEKNDSKDQDLRTVRDHSSLLTGSTLFLASIISSPLHVQLLEAIFLGGDSTKQAGSNDGLFPGAPSKRLPLLPGGWLKVKSLPCSRVANHPARPKWRLLSALLATHAGHLS